MKDLDNLKCALVFSHTTEKTQTNIYNIGFYDPEVETEHPLPQNVKGPTFLNLQNLFIVSAMRFLEYTDGSAESNATIRQRFPLLTAFIEGGVATISEVEAVISTGSDFYELRNNHKFPDDSKVFAQHDAWSIRRYSSLYAITVEHAELNPDEFERFGDGTVKGILRNVSFKLATPEIPKFGNKIFSNPVRFDELSSFRDVKRLLLSLIYWPKEILLFTAVTKYFQERPFYSTVVYHPSYHTLKDVFVRLFSHTKKGFTTSLYDILKVLDILKRHDAGTKDANKFIGTEKIGGIESVTIKAFLGLKHFCKYKQIKDFKEIVNKEAEKAKEFWEKLKKVQEECEKILETEEDPDLSDLSRKLIENLYEEVLLDPTSFVCLVSDGARKTEYRDLEITKVLTALCLTTPIEDNLLKETTNEKSDDATAEGNSVQSADGSTLDRSV
jgi:hypothetical protein